MLSDSRFTHIPKGITHCHTTETVTSHSYCSNVESSTYSRQVISEMETENVTIINTIFEVLYSNRNNWVSVHLNNKMLGFC